MEDIDKEISEMKISLNARARIVAEGFLKNVSLYIILVWKARNIIILSLYFSSERQELIFIV